MKLSHGFPEITLPIHIWRGFPPGSGERKRPILMLASQDQAFRQFTMRPAICGEPFLKANAAYTNLQSNR